jgi:hypothetical protein
VSFLGECRSIRKEKPMASRPLWRTDAGSDRRRDVIELAGGELAQLINKARFRERLEDALPLL